MSYIAASSLSKFSPSCHFIFENINQTYLKWTVWQLWYVGTLRLSFAIDFLLGLSQKRQLVGYKFSSVNKVFCTLPWFWECARSFHVLSGLLLTLDSTNEKHRGRLEHWRSTLLAVRHLLHHYCLGNGSSLLSTATGSIFSIADRHRNSLMGLIRTSCTKQATRFSEKPGSSENGYTTTQVASPS